MRKVRHALQLVLIVLVAVEAAAASPAAAPDAAPPAVAAARGYWADHGAERLAEFAELLSIPNVAADPDGLRRNAAWIRDAFARRGAAAELLAVEGSPPAVYATLPAAGATRTVGIYAHYDGQPVDPEHWAQSPWAPTLYTRAIEAGGTPRPLPAAGESIDPEWRLYARSASDDKAPVAALLAALDALAGPEAANLPRRSNLVFLFEGEEEAGSPHLGALMERYRERLAADVWLIWDGPVHQSRRPQLVFGVRGVAGLEITVYGADRELHSGHYGNWVPNPALALAHLLASMKDTDGRVTIAGYYDSMAPVEPAVAAAAAALPPFEDDLRRELGLAATEGGAARYLDRLLVPSLNVRGLASAGVGAAARNVVPATATASLDLRLVPGEDPAAMLDLVEAHVRRQGYFIVRAAPTREERLAHPLLAKVERLGGYPAVRTRLDDPAAGWVRGVAERVAGGELIVMPTLGGSLPLYVFVEKLGAPIVIVPIVNHDNNQHAADENLRLGNLAYGIELAAALFTAE